MNIEPLHNNVVVKPASQEEMTSSGLVLPQTSEEKPMQGEVLAVGPGRLDEEGKRLPMSVKVGDTVLYTKYAPDEVEIDGEEYLVIGEDKIIGVIKK
jgi:chaperonin GroES